MDGKHNIHIVPLIDKYLSVIASAQKWWIFKLVCYEMYKQIYIFIAFTSSQKIILKKFLEKSNVTDSKFIMIMIWWYILGYKNNIFWFSHFQ